jgi:hypothetical protein
MAHTVFCVKLKKEMPGLDEPPFDNDLGRKVYDNVSQEAWRMWTEHCKMLRIPLEPSPPRRSGSDRQADGPIFLWRRFGCAQGIRASSPEMKPSFAKSSQTTQGIVPLWATY